ncbi:hypothetical protein KJ359_006148 [Pestalotiopsis sp. 9143b]|nr:hypothetical protein KJ359_006148 [Pestalotiopsis sp. 9143b]
MASELPEGALRKIADSVKNLITPAEGPDTTTAEPSARGMPPETGAGTAQTQSRNTEQTLCMEQAAPVEHETVKRLEHEVVETVVDREIHQDHYHRTIQPVKERVVLPTKHIYIDTEEERVIERRDDGIAEGASRDAHLYPDEGVGGHNLRSTKKQLPTLQNNEHTNCYVEETVRNVVTKETIIPPPIETTQHIHKSRQSVPEQQSTATEPEAIAGESRKRDKPSKKAGKGTGHK